MTIASDFNMYYRNSLIGVRRGGNVEPFYVQRVDSRNDENVIEDLVYRGLLVTGPSGATEELSFRHSETVLPLPTVGYVKPGRNPIWLSYRAVRGNSKGINMDRLAADVRFDLNTKMMYSIYHPNFEGRFSEDCCKNRSDLLYCGAKIGDFRGDSSFTLPRKLSYLHEELERVTSCRAIIVDR